ncbi:hypothetical protein LSH36_798g00036 [Paralvinella palmiformis]|uniref:Uncharacterized protein n=1 Tax=Paralvinella palmiformis TaxID=53620 RepID=A0AAD9IZT4_9ANNE|nr:hypothetical protein LSH36_798g00036 [Paralvinella palmiformis]
MAAENTTIWWQRPVGTAEPRVALAEMTTHTRTKKGDPSVPIPSPVNTQAPRDRHILYQYCSLSPAQSHVLAVRFPYQRKRYPPQIDVSPSRLSLAYIFQVDMGFKADTTPSLSPTVPPPFHPNPRDPPLVRCHRMRGRSLGVIRFLLIVSAELNASAGCCYIH